MKIDPFEPKTIEKTLRYASNSGTKRGSFLILLMMGLCVFTEFAMAWEPEYQYLGWATTITGGGQHELDPVNSQIQYFLDGSQGLYKSLDGGKTWTHKANGYNPELNESYCYMQISPLEHETLYLSITSTYDSTIDNKGLYVSHDAGDSWERIYAPAKKKTETWTVWAHPNRENYLLMIISRDFVFNLAWSDDGGVTWTICKEMAGHIAEKIYFIESVPGLVLAIFDNGLFYSMDDGQTWERYGIPVPGRIRDLSICPDDPSFMYAAVDNGYLQHKGVYVTFDYGLSWYLLKEMSFYVPYVAVDYRNGISIFTEYWHSDDGGVTWYENPWKASQIEPISTFRIDPQHPGVVFKSNDYGLSITRDNGWTWEQHAMNNYIGSCVQSPSNPDVIYAATGNSGVIKSTDGGRTWITKSHGIGLHQGCDFLRIDPKNDDILYCGGGSNGALYRSIDGAKNWHIVNSDFAYDLAIDPFNSSCLYAVFYGRETELSGVAISEDYGETWHWSSWIYNNHETVIDMISTSPHMPGLVYLIAFNSDDWSIGLWKSEDGAESWEPLPVPVAENKQVKAIHPDPFTPGVLYVERAHDRALISRDWGKTWSDDIDSAQTFTDSNPSLVLNPAHPGEIIARSDQNTFYIPDVYRTCEGGYRWQNVAKEFYLLLVGNDTVPAIYGVMARYPGVFKVEDCDMYKIEFKQNKPVIEMAGYGRTRLSEAGGGLLQILCDVSCPDCDPGYPEVELTYEGIPAGLYLNDKGIQGDETAGDGRYTIEVDIPGNVLSPATYSFGLVARDASGTISDRWPKCNTK